MGSHPEGGSSFRKLSTEEVLKGQVGLLEWELEERERHHNEDHLTGATTRKVCESILEQSLKIVRGEVSEHRQGVEPLTEISVVLLDLDHFKEVNDTFGHAEGDKILVRAVEVLRGQLRATDTLARLGGDEFVILLPNSDAKDAMVVSEKLRSSLERDELLKEHKITASIGVCSSGTSETDDPKIFLSQADKAAYEAKRGGRNKVVAYTKDLGE